MNTSTAGQFEEQIILHSTGSNATGYSNDLSDQTITILRTVLAPSPTLTIELSDDTGSSSTDKVTSDDTLSGTTDPGSVVSFTIDASLSSSTATADATGHWTFVRSGLSAGNHNIVASVTNSFGETGTAALTFTLLPQTFTDVFTNGSGGSWTVAANWSAGTPSGASVVSLPLSSGETVTISSGTNAVSQTVGTGSGGTLSLTGGSRHKRSSDLAGSLSLSGGALTLGAPTGVKSLTQSGGTLSGVGALTVAGSSTLSGGSEIGAGTTIAEGGATFNDSSFYLDGGRTLELDGSSAATGSYDYIYLNGPTDDAPDPNAGTLTVASGATFNDETTGYLQIYAPNEGADNSGANAAVNNEGTWTESGGATSYIDTIFNNTGAVNVQSGTLNLAGGGTDVGGAYEGAGTIEFSATRTLDSASSITTANVDFSGGTTTVDGTYNSSTSTQVTGGTVTLAGSVLLWGARCQYLAEP